MQKTKSDQQGSEEKNRLICGSDTGGERAATFYRLVRTARLNGVDSAQRFQPIAILKCGHESRDAAAQWRHMPSNRIVMGWL